MSLLNQNKESRKVSKGTAAKDALDFSKVGGLRHHIKILREVIIFPLLHGHIFSHFNIKAPRGVLFYGPPGTGKTLVAGALASEINREGIGKVTFFQRKGADMLEKWVGESEKRLRALFEKATKCRPSIIFFDEIDGLAPIRSDKNDHIHSSLVATLLALMDGLDTKPGVIVIGATNRIEAVDPALRRPGRFDKELYFPLPGVEARKEIIEVHTGTWDQQLTSIFINKLADLTAGFCGADIQALCSEAVLCCVKRQYPKINNIASKVKIEADSLKVEEADFLEAKMNILPSTMKRGHKMRNLSQIIKPLLKRQQNRVIRYIQLLWPHFLQEAHKYTLGEKRYVGRILLIGSNMQGLNTHLIPSILKHLEHLPTFVFDSKIFHKMKMNLASAQSVFPAVILLSRIDEWWDYIDECEQHSIVSTLEDIHAGLPVLTIASCTTDIPSRFHNFFYNNSTILIKIDDPTDEEREHFLAPLFFGDKCVSLHRVLENCKRSIKKTIKPEMDTVTKSKKDNGDELKIEDVHSLTNGKRKCDDYTVSNQAIVKKIKLCENKFGSYQSNSYINTDNAQKTVEATTNESQSRFERHQARKRYFTRVLSDLLNQRNMWRNYSRSYALRSNYGSLGTRRNTVNSLTAAAAATLAFKRPVEDQMRQVYKLWKHAALVTSRQMAVAQLELLYDVISACISIHQHSFEALVEHLENILKKIEYSNQITDSQTQPEESQSKK